MAFKINKAELTITKYPSVNLPKNANVLFCNFISGSPWICYQYNTAHESDLVQRDFLMVECGEEWIDDMVRCVGNFTTDDSIPKNYILYEKIN